jgi:hypothetical protein
LKTILTFEANRDGRRELVFSIRLRDEKTKHGVVICPAEFVEEDLTPEISRQDDTDRFI